MSYKEKIVELLKENMTEKGFKLWQGIDRVLPDVWNKPTSSTGKHHKKLNGEVPSNAEHVYQMLYAACKIFRLFNIRKKTSDCDSLLFSVVLHDALKYGQLGTRKHTDSAHDKEAGDMIASNKETFLKILGKSIYIIIAVGYSSRKVLGLRISNTRTAEDLMTVFREADQNTLESIRMISADAWGGKQAMVKQLNRPMTLVIHKHKKPML